jgi:hypothetical protein
MPTPSASGAGKPGSEEVTVTLDVTELFPQLEIQDGDTFADFNTPLGYGIRMIPDYPTRGPCVAIAFRKAGVVIHHVLSAEEAIDMADRLRSAADAVRVEKSKKSSVKNLEGSDRSR